MITDKQSNFVYLSNLFEQRCPKEYRQLKHWFEKLNIENATLPNTKDLWVVDFMPLQIREDCFIQFEYNPDYLKSKKDQLTKTDPEIVCLKLGIIPDKANIILDGGNIVKSSTKVIITTKVFKDNPDFVENDLIAAIKKCKLPQKQYGLKVDEMFNFKIVTDEKESIYAYADCGHFKGV